MSKGKHQVEKLAAKRGGQIKVRRKEIKEKRMK